MIDKTMCEVLRRNISDFYDSWTRFVAIVKAMKIVNKADDPEHPVTF